MNKNYGKMPRIRQAGLFALPGYELFTLENGLRVYYIRDNSINTCRVEWVFAAGRAYEKVTAQSEMTANLLRESNSRYSAYKNAEFFDQLGSSMYIYNGLDHAVAGFASLSRWARLLFDRALLSLRSPGWKAADLKIVRKIKTDNLRESLADNDILSYRVLTEKLFGRQHPYGYNTTENMLAGITMEDLQQHWEQNYFNDSMYMVLAGNVTEADLAYMLDAMGRIRLQPAASMQHKIMLNAAPMADPVVNGKNQKSIKTGRKIIRRDHPDFTAVYMISMLLGGYFNSRLNKSIREKKGLTYHISSQLDSAQLGGLFYITSDTSAQHADRVVSEINRELAKICGQAPSRTELNMLKSYLLGNMLNFYEGAYATADTLRQALMDGVSYEANARLMEEIKHMEPEQLPAIACKYFAPAQMRTVIAG